MTAVLWLQLAIAGVMVLGTVLLHLGGILVMISLLRRHHHHRDRLGVLGHEVIAMLGAAAMLFFLHGLEIWAYALLYAGTGALGSFEEALYFSTSTYTTIGDSGLNMARQWRVLGAIEGANGMILLAWSAAVFVAIVARMKALDDAWFTDGRRDAAGLETDRPPSRTQD